jgi:uncharacterized protein (TIGR00730 family)
VCARRQGIVFGGGRIGLMGALADEALTHGGEVIGVMPRSLVEREVAHGSLTELRVTDSMHERKALMEQLSSRFVALPGGIGTLEELVEMLTWAQLGLHHKPCGLLNVDGYYDSLLAFLDCAVDEGFLTIDGRQLLIVGDEPGELLDALDRHARDRHSAGEIRRARPDQAEALSALAIRSKAHWGYDAEFMQLVAPMLTFSADAVRDQPVYVLDVDGELAGFYRLAGAPPTGWLEDLWLEPDWIGRGAGRRLFEHALATAGELGFEALQIEADPNAEGFYLAMGAVRVGDVRSDSGRTLPLLRVVVP